MDSVLVLGYFGYRTNQLDGQTVKTISLYKLLNEITKDVKYYDTQEFQFNKKSIISMLWRICRCKTLIYLPAQNNLKWIFPLIFIISSVTRINIRYFVVGGWLKEFLSDKPVHRWMLKNISGIYTETLLMKKELEARYNYKNVGLFPNFRFYNRRCNINSSNKILKMVFMARINKLKGLDMIFELGNFIKNNDFADKVSIDFYGPVFEGDNDYFKRNVCLYPFMKYAGTLQPDDIYDVLEKYDVMLFPTHYFTEGLPGSIVDAYISGLPVIATKWKHASEFIEDGVSGIVVPFDNGQTEFNNAVSFLISNPEQLSQMKENARQRSFDFSSEHALNLLKEIL